MKSKIQNEPFKLAMKAFLDQNAIFLTNLTLPREVRCHFCKTTTGEASLYLNHNAIGEAFILCERCHDSYQTPQQRIADA